MVSAVELNVGIICICMPSFRRFMQRFLPAFCGGTTHSDSYKNYDDDQTPPNRLESGPKGARAARKKKSSLDSDLLNTITKTVDTRVGVVTVKEEEEDEIRLVELQNKKKNDATGSVGSAEGQESLYSGYKKQHQGTLPSNW